MGASCKNRLEMCIRPLYHSRNCGFDESAMWQNYSLNCYWFPSPLVFPGGSDSKEFICNAGDVGSIPGSEVSLEKRMATHSSTLAWRIPWTEEPGVLQFMGSERVGRN